MLREDACGMEIKIQMIVIDGGLIETRIFAERSCQSLGASPAENTALKKKKKTIEKIAAHFYKSIVTYPEIRSFRCAAAIVAKNKGRRVMDTRGAIAPTVDVMPWRRHRFPDFGVCAAAVADASPKHIRARQPGAHRNTKCFAGPAHKKKKKKTQS
jgi:hypothetical protein